MMRFGLTGYPLGHSLSPRLHNSALLALGLEGEYSLYPAPPLPDGARRLEALLAAVRRSDLQGLNVTIPHKQSVLAWLDRLTRVAEAVGAVNTVFLQGDVLIGDNTDVGGFRADLERVTNGRLGGNRSALVFGAGGSARAVVYALALSGWQVTVAARRIEQAQELCEALSGLVDEQFQPIIVDENNDPGLEASAGSRAYHEDRLKPRLQELRELTPIHLEFSSISNLQSPISLIVNTTPVGMTPHPEASPWPKEIPFPPDAVVYDLVYNPLETALLRSARQAGLPAYSGLGMLVEQAALAFERWTGLEAPRESMRRSVNLLEFSEKT